MITEEGSARHLTQGELKMAKAIFKDAIDYRRVRVHHGSYFPFGMQNNKTAVTPNGHMYYPTLLYKDDFYQKDIRQQWLFIHEMVHVWQHQLGVHVRDRGLISWLVDYQYYLKESLKLSDYGLEQQASLIADYYILKEYGYKKWSERNFKYGIGGYNIIDSYEIVLSLFLSDPSDIRNRP